MKQKIKTVAMFGPSISDPSKTVNRDVPEKDIQAYRAAGYKLGSKPEAIEDIVARAVAEKVAADEIKAEHDEPVTRQKGRAKSK